MADRTQLHILAGGAEQWNRWRLAHDQIVPDLSAADLHERVLKDINLSYANLEGANLSGAFMEKASLAGASLDHAVLNDAYLAWASLGNVKLRHAPMQKAHLYAANLRGADLSDSDLTGANLRWTNLRDACLDRTSLREAKLGGAVMVGTSLQDADLTGAFVHGLSVWDANLAGATQANLVITDEDQPVVTVDDLEVAHFMYTLLTNRKVRGIIDTITSRVVVILGRFIEERKAVLDALRLKLRDAGYVPILFDFEKPYSRDLDETVSLLAHMARFVVADVTDAKSVLQELRAIAPDLPSVPIQPLLLASQQEPGMFEHFRRYPWVLDTYVYEDQTQLLDTLETSVIRPAERIATEQQAAIAAVRAARQR